MVEEIDGPAVRGQILEDEALFELFLVATQPAGREVPGG